MWQKPMPPDTVSPDIAAETFIKSNHTRTQQFSTETNCVRNHFIRHNRWLQRIPIKLCLTKQQAPPTCQKCR